MAKSKSPTPAPSPPGEEEATRLAELLAGICEAVGESRARSLLHDSKRPSEAGEATKCGLACAGHMRNDGRKIIASAFSRARSEQKRRDAGRCEEIAKSCDRNAESTIDEDAESIERHRAKSARECAAEIGKERP
jgi:hypothetical protein